MTIQTERSSGLDVPTFDIMLDVDDVIVPWFDTVDAKCREMWDIDPSYPPCEAWSMHGHYGRTREEWEQVVIAATVDGLYTNIDPFPGVVAGINGLLWRGHRIHIVTARGFMANGENIRRWTHEYLHRYAIGYTTLTFAKKKSSAMKELGLEFDFAIDDGVHNYEDLALAGVNVFLQDAPHNRSFDTSFRVGSLWEFAQIVHRQQSSQKPLVVEPAL